MRRAFHKRLTILRGIDRYHRAHHPEYPHRLDLASLHHYLTLLAGLIRVEAGVRWCDEALRGIRQWEKKAARRRTKKAQ